MMMREGLIMQGKKKRFPVDHADVAFLPAITPLEAAVIPAKERNRQERYGVLRMMRYACEAGDACLYQRAKIWVR